MTRFLVVIALALTGFAIAHWFPNNAAFFGVAADTTGRLVFYFLALFGLERLISGEVKRRNPPD
jgi:hypothetical protein